MTRGPGIEPGIHWWQASALITALKGGFHGFALVCIIYLHVHTFWHRPSFSLFMNQS